MLFVAAVTWDESCHHYTFVVDTNAQVCSPNIPLYQLFNVAHNIWKPGVVTQPGMRPLIETVLNQHSPARSKKKIVNSCYKFFVTSWEPRHLWCWVNASVKTSYGSMEGDWVPDLHYHLTDFTFYSREELLNLRTRRCLEEGKITIASYWAHTCTWLQASPQWGVSVESSMLTGWRTLRDVYISARGITSLRQLVWPPLQLAMPALVSHECLHLCWCGLAPGLIAADKNNE